MQHAVHFGIGEVSSLRHRLRASVASLHSRVDTRMTELLARPDGYEQFLSATAGALLPLERALESADVSRIVPDWAQRARSAALRSDLADLALIEPAFEARLPQSDGAFILGVLYVLEGSRLGSRVVLRQLQMSAPTQLKGATRYLSHGEGLPLWKTFLAQLEASQPARDDPEAAIAGARAAFELFLIRAGAA